MIRTTPLSVLLGALAPAFLASCNPPEDSGIKEKVSLLEAELRDRDEQLATLQEQDDTEPEPASAAPDLEAAKGGYLGFVEELRQELAGEMPTVKFDRTSVSPVVGPDPSKPIASQVAYRVVGSDGRTGEITIPLFAGPDGQWLEPSIPEIIATFKSKPATAAAATTPEPPPRQAPAQPARPNDVMGANKTFDVDWGDPPKQGPQRPAPQQPAPQPPAQPAPAAPKKVMPTDRDVIIDFE